MKVYTLDTLDKIVCRRWPEQARKSAHERLNACALVKDVLEGHGRFTVSEGLAEEIRQAARDVEEDNNGELALETKP